MMGTEIFLIEPKGAEKMEIKDFNLHTEIMSITTFLFGIFWNPLVISFPMSTETL